MKIVTTLAALSLAAACTSAFAESAPTRSDLYFRDLGRMIGAIRAMQWTVDICETRNPESAAANRVALEEWKTRHKAFIDEMNARFEEMPAYWKRQDPQHASAIPALWAEVNRQIDGLRDTVEQQYLKELGEAKFGLLCANYPSLLQSEIGDLEQSNADELAMIRRGPG